MGDTMSDVKVRGANPHGKGQKTQGQSTTTTRKPSRAERQAQRKARGKGYDIVPRGRRKAPTEKWKGQRKRSPFAPVDQTVAGRLDQGTKDTLDRHLAVVSQPTLEDVVHRRPGFIEEDKDEGIKGCQKKDKILLRIGCAYD